jgi:GNAT superfamily N-acetyltransferase
MRVIDLDSNHEVPYFACLKDWDQRAEAALMRAAKKAWYEKMKGRGLRVKLSLDDDERVGGMIQHIPIEYSFAEGSDLFLIQCVWVHTYSQGRGSFHGQGMGKALLEAAETDAKRRGAKGMAAWGIDLPDWKFMVPWYRQHGYVDADLYGARVLLWKAFTDDAVSPKWIKRRREPTPIPGRVAVTCFTSGWCPDANEICEYAKRAAHDSGDEVAFREIDTSDRETFLEWGVDSALYIDGKEVRPYGPPPTYEDIKGMIAARKKASSGRKG